MTTPGEAAGRELAEKLREQGQEHLLRRSDELDEAQRRHLMAQLAGLDFARLAEFRLLLGTPPTDISFEDVMPGPVERLPLNEAGRDFDRAMQRLGREALGADRVAALTASGGHGTRLDYPHPKGTYPISPVLGKSLFQLFAEQIAATRRRYGCALPWLIMTSPANDGEVRAFFEQNEFFGLDSESVHFFVQEVNPILDEAGRLLLADRGELLVGPDGHGGVFAALERSGLTQMLRQDGRDLISYFQVDNPLMSVADPRFIGHHLHRGADFSCKVIAKRSPDERLGLAVMKGGVPAVVEYSDVPEEVAAARLPTGRLRLRYGSIASHVLDVPFAERVARRQEGLPWHIAAKTYEVLDEQGRKAPSPAGACRKFERFIFDALAFAEDFAFVEVRRESEFAPVKNADGEDSPRTARRLMQRRWLEWLRAAGAVTAAANDPSAGPVEIGPLYAADAEELKSRIEPGWQPTFPLVLEE